ncbi:MAG: heparinase, partial [Lacunisphaera sp.]|nr:heparinase [Lacunisphaera sp.]
EGRPEPFGYWRGVTGAICRDRVEFDVDYGKVVLHVTIATPGEFRVWHGDTPDSPPRRRESLYVEVAGTKAAVFTTTFAPAT